VSARRAAAKPTLAVVGATGAVGTVMLDLLSTRDDVWGEVRLIASPRSAGRHLRVRGADIEVLALAPEVFDGVDVAMFDVPDEISAKWAPVAVDRGAVVVEKIHEVALPCTPSKSREPQLKQETAAGGEFPTWGSPPRRLCFLARSRRAIGPSTLLL